MIQATLSDIARQLNTVAPTQPVDFRGISIDTRTLSPGNLFVAIRGEQFDGHQFVREAHQKGAVAALVSQPVDCDLPQLVVKDTILALGDIAKNWRDRFTLPCIAVTGSNGKTTLKNMIASILRAACDDQADQVLATEGNLNNNIGVPLMLTRLNENHRYLVLEMGMNHFGEIDYLTKLARPDIAVINNAAEAHLAGLKNVAGVAKAKGEIFSGLTKNGTAILNRDDAHFNYWKELIGDHAFLTFGLDHPADMSTTYTQKKSLCIKTPKGEMTVELPLPGRHNAANALAATACAIAATISLSAIKTGLEQVKPAKGRMRQYPLPNQVTVIDDTYNANPFSLQAAVNTLAACAGTKIVVLGDMKELGPDEKTLHYNSGEKIRAAGIDYLFTFGNLSEETTRAFGKNAWHFTEREALIEALLPYLTENVTVLVKGSRSMQMEKIANRLVPENELDKTHERAH
ncbi:MAG TPA: UDP-N-acetylmuramoyl-tripeptide--D-alanyl-D-alanine ligase [Gammaproteobacteria bacterium]|nr:UDP-N-acetylmuramoyl-tripeptide--D-alanyl-D-alanine ligase [Gammaproteobacteria bacterium]